MSGRYVSRVLESALGSELKFTAAVFASFADDDGRCWPSIGQVAYLRGVQVRAVQYHVKELQHMEILDVVRPATQWAPTHYRIVLDKLPTRAPYRPPDRQPQLFGPRGESPGPDPSGVQPAAPQLGVQSSVPGVQPGAPDPSVRSVSTHTYDAHARGPAPEPPAASRGESRDEETAAGVQPAAPQTSAIRLPLVVPVRTTDHEAHAWCGRICVPKFLHRSFKKALGGPVAKRAQRMRTFYRETVDAIPAARPIGAEPVKFWRAAFAARFQASPMRAGSARPTDGGRLACPHDPSCATIGACSARIVRDGREARARHSG